MRRKGDRQWTDEEYGYVQDTMKEPAAEVAAALGRSRDSVYNVRSKLRAGFVPTVIPWSEDEDQYLRDTRWLTAEKVAEHLNRTYGSVAKRRNVLFGKEGIEAAPVNKSPTSNGKRLLIAKTCPKCGLLLDAFWFLKTKSGGHAGMWTTYCRKCSGSGKRDDQGKARDRKHQSARLAVLQRLSLRHAERKGEEWTEADQRVLADPDLTVFEKSALTRRTYFATANAIERYGHKFSKPDIGDPKDSQWAIHLHPDVQRMLAVDGAMAA